jgi:hypothetical protein
LEPRYLILELIAAGRQRLMPPPKIFLGELVAEIELKDVFVLSFDPFELRLGRLNEPRLFAHELLGGGGMRVDLLG